MAKNSTRKLKSPAVKPEPGAPEAVLAAPLKAQPALSPATKALPLPILKAQPPTATGSAPAPQPVPPVKASPAQEPPAKPALRKSPHVLLEFLKPDAKKVCVAGSFNGWKPDQTPLAPMGNGRWVGDLAVNPGKYEYLFVVDGQWLPDPNAKESVQNPFGGRNSLLTVSE